MHHIDQMSEPKKNTGVRLTDEQIAGLKAEAKIIQRELRASGLTQKVGWTTVVGIAVDHMLLNKGRAKKRVLSKAGA